MNTSFIRFICAAAFLLLIGCDEGIVDAEDDASPNIPQQLVVANETDGDVEVTIFVAERDSTYILRPGETLRDSLFTGDGVIGVDLLFRFEVPPSRWKLAEYSWRGCIENGSELQFTIGPQEIAQPVNPCIAGAPEGCMLVEPSTTAPFRTTLLARGDYEGAGAVFDLWGYLDAATSTEYALVAYDGFQVFDVTNPEAPRFVARIEAKYPRDIKTWRHYAYATEDRWGVIIDLSDPESPEVVADAPGAHNLFIDDRGFLYASRPGLRIYDLNEDPTNPTLVWESQEWVGHAATVVGNRLYDVAGTVTNIYDVSDPSSPSLISTIEYEVLHHSAWPSEDGNHLFITTEGVPAMLIYDISDVENPRYVNCLQPAGGTLHDIYIIGDLAYTSAYHLGFKVFDVSNPNKPELYAEYDTPQEGVTGSFGAYPFTLDGSIFVSDESGLYIFTVED